MQNADRKEGFGWTKGNKPTDGLKRTRILDRQHDFLATRMTLVSSGGNYSESTSVSRHMDKSFGYRTS
jgi:hypothetical protein